MLRGTNERLDNFVRELGNFLYKQDWCQFTTLRGGVEVKATSASISVYIDPCKHSSGNFIWRSNTAKIQSVILQFILSSFSADFQNSLTTRKIRVQHSIIHRKCAISHVKQSIRSDNIHPKHPNIQCEHSMPTFNSNIQFKHSMPTFNPNIQFEQALWHIDAGTIN